MEENFLFYEELPAEKSILYKSKLNKLIYFSLIYLAISLIFLIMNDAIIKSYFLDVYQDIPSANVFTIMLSFFLVFSMFILGIIFFFFKKGLKKELDVGVNEDGIILNKVKFYWREIHAINPVPQKRNYANFSVFQLKATKGGFWTSKLIQTIKGNFWLFEVKNKKGFEEALSKAGADNILNQKTIGNIQKNFFRMLIILGIFIFTLANVIYRVETKNFAYVLVLSVWATIFFIIIIEFERLSKLQI
ncbi:MAG: hypothetical protein ABIE23_05390 [archaeon]